MKKHKSKSAARVLFLDIETSPLVSYTWGLFDQNIGLEQIKEDWFILSVAAKWQDSDEIFYFDQSKAKDMSNDKPMLEKVWKLLDECDILVGQNLKKFDHKKLNARFLMHDMPAPSSYRMIDTLVIAKKHFALTSNKLSFMTSKLNTKYKKLSHADFPGFSLWSECLKGNKKAWKAMKEYNIYDVLSLQEVFEKLSKWDNSIDFSVYSDDLDKVCSCGSKEFKKNGYRYTNTGRFQRYKCVKCHRESQSKINLLSKEKKASLKD